MQSVSYDIAAGYGRRPAIRSFANLCAPGAVDAPLTGEILALDWERYPGLSPTLWVPTVTFQLCNPGAQVLNGFLKVRMDGSATFEGDESLSVPVLETGAGTGPVKLYLPVGLPDALFDLVDRRQLPWPEITIRLSYNAAPEVLDHPLVEGFLAVPTGKVGVSTPQWELPAEPSPALLRASNWTGRELTLPDGNELFVYSPAMRFFVIGLIGCNPPGGLGARSESWSFWAVPPQGGPRRLASLGEWLFQGSYTWSIEERPEARSTFLLLHQPSGCHFPAWSALWHYDPGTGALVRPTITVGTDEVPAGAASLVINQDGSLFAWDLATVGQEVPWTKVTYHWNRQGLNWSLSNTVPPDQNGVPPSGPGGAPTVPGGVYTGASRSPGGVYPGR